MQRFELFLLYVVAILWAFFFLLFGTYLVDLAQDKPDVNIATTSIDDTSTTTTESDKAKLRQQHHSNMKYMGITLIVMGFLPITGLFLYSLSTVPWSSY